MSSRQTIVFVPPIHIYNECISDQICIEFEMIDLGSDPIRFVERNKKYGSPVLTKEQLVQIRDELNRFLLVYDKAAAENEKLKTQLAKFQSAPKTSTHTPNIGTCENHIKAHQNALPSLTTELPIGVGFFDEQYGDKG